MPPEHAGRRPAALPLDSIVTGRVALKSTASALGRLPGVVSRAELITAQGRAHDDLVLALALAVLAARFRAEMG